MTMLRSVLAALACAGLAAGDAGLRFFAVSAQLRPWIQETGADTLFVSLPPSTVELVAFKSDVDVLSLGVAALNKLEVALPMLGHNSQLGVASLDDFDLAADSTLVYLVVKPKRDNSVLASLKQRGIITYSRIVQDFYLIAFRASNHGLVDAALYAFDKEVIAWNSEKVSSETAFAPSSFDPVLTVMAEKNATIQKISASVYENFLAVISGDKTVDAVGSPFKTRYTLAPGHLLALEYAAAELSKLNYFDQIFTQEHTVSGSKTKNLIAVKKGTVAPNEVVVAGAHFDSTSENPKTLAPGAIDNGSGSAAVFAIAEAFSKNQYAPSKTLQFVLFTGEEQGLYGSKYFVANFPGPGKITAALTLDMIGYSKKFKGVKIEGTTNAEIQKLMKLIAQNLDVYSPEIAHAFSNNSFGSDHVSFQKAGIPAILAIELDDTDYPAYHRSADVFANNDRAQSFGILKGLAGALVDLSL